MLPYLILIAFVAQVAFVGWAGYRLGRAQAPQLPPRAPNGRFTSQKKIAYEQTHADLRAAAGRSRGETAT